MIRIEPNWRHSALEFLPELSQEIQEADNPYMLWIDIRLIFIAAYSIIPYDESIIQRIYQFAQWCFRQPRGKSAEDDLLTCVFVCFYEHISENTNALEDLPRWISPEDFSVVSDVLKKTMKEHEYRSLRILVVGPQGSER